MKTQLLKHDTGSDTSDCCLSLTSVLNLSRVRTISNRDAVLNMNAGCQSSSASTNRRTSSNQGQGVEIAFHVKSMSQSKIRIAGSMSDPGKIHRLSSDVFSVLEKTGAEECDVKHLQH